MWDERQLSSSANMNYLRSTLTTKNQIGIEEDFARPLTVDIGEGEDEDGTSVSNSSAQQQG